jgi:Alpha-glutamyl/putrescinyl thymine pyrophosphorylase clade 3
MLRKLRPSQIVDDLEPRLNTYAARRNPPGLRSSGARVRFIDELRRALVGLTGLRNTRSGPINPWDESFDVYSAVVALASSRETEEALWLSFLTTACGRLGGDTPWRTVRGLYGRLGEAPSWRWRRVSAKPGAFRRWLLDNRAQVKELPYGNHRKYETNDARKAGSLADVVESYVKWVHREGRGSQVRIFQEALKEESPEAAFDWLYRKIKVRRFGRTAKFDWLCLLGNLDLYRITPGKLYLRGASGPRSGAALFFFSGRRGGNVDRFEAEAAILREALQVPIEAIEDTLCNWQKKRRPGVQGWVTTACHG